MVLVMTVMITMTRVVRVLLPTAMLVVNMTASHLNEDICKNHDMRGNDLDEAVAIAVSMKTSARMTI